ncbi:MAG: glycosyltransferase family 4 protein [bacterium]|nr:glycosyltransferase family 4 protein [bacterium]
MFAGAVDDVMAMLPACDLFVLPSLWEGLPVALVEAMGMGLPVVATEVGGTPEVVNDGTTGLLVRPGDAAMLAAAIDRLIIDEPFAARWRMLDGDKPATTSEWRKSWMVTNRRSIGGDDEGNDLPRRRQLQLRRRLDDRPRPC